MTASHTAIESRPRRFPAPAPDCAPVAAESLPSCKSRGEAQRRFVAQRRVRARARPAPRKCLQLRRAARPMQGMRRCAGWVVGAGASVLAAARDSMPPASRLTEIVQSQVAKKVRNGFPGMDSYEAPPPARRDSSLGRPDEASGIDAARSAGMPRAGDPESRRKL